MTLCERIASTQRSLRMSVALPTLFIGLAVACAVLPRAQAQEVFYWKDSYGRGVGTIPDIEEKDRCKHDKVKDAGLCYERCRPGHHGIGPVCWGDTPPHFVECGAGYAVDKSQCSQVVSGQTMSIGMFAASLCAECVDAAKARIAKNAKNLAKVKAAEEIFKDVLPFAQDAEKVVKGKNVETMVKHLDEISKAWDKFYVGANKQKIDALLAGLDNTDKGNTAAGALPLLGTGKYATMDTMRNVASLVSILPAPDPASEGLINAMGVVSSFLYPTYQP